MTVMVFILCVLAIVAMLLAIVELSAILWFEVSGQSGGNDDDRAD